MRLGTTVKPVEGPHDLDFVCEIDRPHSLVDPMGLFDTLYALFKSHGTYCDMVSRKNRCIRITYANEFYMDILPACRDFEAGGTCLQVPDREMSGWTPSNPIGYANWFHSQSLLRRQRLLAKVSPLPSPQEVEEKRPLQLAVQLMKRWRDLYYSDQQLAPISIVLTTLAANFYQGEESVSEALAAILSGIHGAISNTEFLGHRLRVCNPSNAAEDLTERWDNDLKAYREFKSGISAFQRKWSAILGSTGNVYAGLESLFGEPAERAMVKQAQKLQEARGAGLLGVQSAGVISSLASAAVKIRPNTFHGKG
jgi:hypothetical protein